MMRVLKTSTPCVKTGGRRCEKESERTTHGMTETLIKTKRAIAVVTKPLCIRDAEVKRIQTSKMNYARPTPILCLTDRFSPGMNAVQVIIRDWRIARG